MLRNNTSASLTATFSGGVSTISFDYKKAFSTSVNLDVFINDVLVTTITSASTTVENSGNIDVYAVGDFTIEFKQNTSPQGGQVLIDNVAWNSYSDGTQEITGTAGWRMLSAPITGFTVSDISDNTAIQGISGGDNTSATANFYYYGSTGSFASPADVSTAFGDGYGFITYFYNNTNAGSSELPITLDVSGTEPSNDVDVTLNKTLTPFENDPSNEDATHYYTLVGNPYASNFDLSTLAVDADALDANVLVWDNASSDYQPMATADGIVAPWQGFWVSVPSNEAATTLTFPTSGKTSLSSTASYFKAVANAQSNIEGLISMSHNGITSAPVKLQMKEDAVLGDDRNDLVKFTPLSSSYATVGALIPASTVLHAIHALPIELSEPVQVIIEPMIKGNSGEFTLNWSAFSSFPDIYVVELFDSETGNTYNLRENGSLTFTQVSKAAATDNDLKTLTATSNGNSRFKVNITPITTSVENGIAVPTTVALSQNFPNPFNPSTKIAYAVPAQASVRLAVYDMLGREVALLVNTVKAAGKYEVTFDASALASGMYIYRLQANGTVLTQKMTLIK
ncbi:T9SS type A sorting domain-containing protein [bacterium]|nr:MAG: T9SS type A sorting domain-containing protein [bacterium]